MAAFAREVIGLGLIVVGELALIYLVLNRIHRALKR